MKTHLYTSPIVVKIGLHCTNNTRHAKKRDILTEKRESGMALVMCDFPPESGNVDTMT